MLRPSVPTCTLNSMVPFSQRKLEELRLGEAEPAHKRLLWYFSKSAIFRNVGENLVQGILSPGGKVNQRLELKRPSS